MKIFLLLILVSTMSYAQPRELARQLLIKIKTEEPVADIPAQLAQLKPDELAQVLSDDPSRLAFWLNIYNAHAQLKYRQDPTITQDHARLFEKRDIVIAGEKLSLDDIEHGLLRHRAKWGMGYFGRWFASDFIKRFHVRELEPRIHFALNCLAASCPPIGFYHEERLSKQLQKATRWYLAQETDIDLVKNQIRIPRLFLWFHHDLNGKVGAQKLLEEFELIPREKKWEIEFKEYDWKSAPANWTKEEL